MDSLHPGTHLETRGDQPAVVMAGSGAIVTYAELDANSKRAAQALFAAGLRPGDHLAVMLENHERYFEVFWAAQRSGLHLTPINWHLTADEAGYIIQDCGAKALVTSDRLADLAERIEPYLSAVTVRLMIDANPAPSGSDPEGATFDDFEQTVGRYPAEELEVELEGSPMFYSSGTTGRPKGIKRAPTTIPFGQGGGGFIGMLQFMYGFTPDTVYLCPAPLYHTAPIGWTTAAQRLGATVVGMERFDAEEALAAIEQHGVTHAQFVPTHFVRMLKLDPAVRARYDTSSLEMVVHAAAPCPVEVKRQMIDWWGPIVHEFYSGSEGSGYCAITPQEWLAHPGSVGKPFIGVPHILDGDGNDVGTGDTGQIWFETTERFEYHNDAVKTAEAFNAAGMSTFGDIGHLDAEGFLYLTDRVSHMIISGGVNIYPQETEDVLTMHPEVADVAVIGVPNADLGEEVKAVVQPVDPTVDHAELEARLIAYCRERIAGYKCPASVDVVDELPRLPTGKLLKRELRRSYET